MSNVVQMKDFKRKGKATFVERIERLYQRGFTEDQIRHTVRESRWYDDDVFDFACDVLAIQGKVSR